MRPTRTSLILLLAAALACGCDEGSSSQDQPSSSAMRVKVASCLAVHRATLQGKVVFDGPVPARRTLSNQPCHPDAKPIYDETIVVGSDSTLRNAVVYLTGVSSYVSFGSPRILDQSDCRYAPHVVAIQVGQTLRVTSSDPTLHNVHIVGDANPSVNLAMTAAGQHHDLKFKAAEFLRAKCDVHPWMTGYIAVIDNPFFSVTTDDGSFNIPNVPPGEYTLACWHERLGELKQQVTIPQDGTVEATFTYKEP